MTPKHSKRKMLKYIQAKLVRHRKNYQQITTFKNKRFKNTILGLKSTGWATLLRQFPFSRRWIVKKMERIITLEIKIFLMKILKEVTIRLQRFNYKQIYPRKRPCNNIGSKSLGEAHCRISTMAVRHQFQQHSHLKRIRKE